MDGRRTLMTAAVLLALATALGALGAHLLRGQLPPSRLQIYETGVRYHFLSALGLLAIGAVLRVADSAPLRGAAVALLIGITLFSGSLYLLAFDYTLGMPRLIGIATPLGGLALISGWLLCAAAFVRRA